jgi:hypothetical protein
MSGDLRDLLLDMECDGAVPGEFLDRFRALIPEGAVLVTEESLAAALHDLGYGCLYPVTAEWTTPEHDDTLHRQDAASILGGLPGGSPTDD